MRTLTLLISGLLCGQIAAHAQTVNNYTGPDDGRAGTPAKTGVIGAGAIANDATYQPPTASERWRSYFIGAFGPQAILRAAAGAGISQWNDTPKEWRQGGDAYGERFGNHLAEHVMRQTMESGAAAVLHEDNRYFPSTDAGFGSRLKHAIGSVFVARNDAGQEHFAYSRFGSAVGASFISRVWQPPSENKAGDAAANFGLDIGVDVGWNVFREFCPKRLRRHL